MQTHLPYLITFDGEARSGKGTIVQGTKDYLRDTCGYKTMLIDAGQVFRVLVIAVTKAGIDPDDAPAVDAFLSDESKAESAVQLVKDVYHMGKDERDALLYTNEVGANSAKIGARPLSQEFKDMLLKKWLRDAQKEGFEVVLLDGRALEEVGKMLETAKLCHFVLGYYFTCDPRVGARRTLGFASEQYEELSADDKAKVDELVNQITTRNTADAKRAVQPIVRPNVRRVELPSLPELEQNVKRHMVLLDTSADMSKDTMIQPVAKLTAGVLAAQ